MIEQLLEAKMISPEDFDMYMHYQVSELGRKLLTQGTMSTFMDEVPATEFNGERLGFNDGRRSVFRDVHLAILRVEQKLKEHANDNGQ